MKIELMEVVAMQEKLYKAKSYPELQSIIQRKGEYLKVRHNGREYSFEINAEYFQITNIRVRIHGERNSLFGWLSGYARYFGMTPEGVLMEASDDVIF